MKMVMIVVDESKKEEVEAVLGEAGVVGYSELSRVAGRGETGPRLGSRTFPGTSAIVFTVLSEESLAALRAAVRELCADCAERFRMISWDVEEVA